MKHAFTGLAAIAALLLASGATAQDLPKTHLKVVGSIGSLAVYRNHEQPFFTKTLPERSKGQVTAEIKPFTEMGLKGPEILRLMKSGVIEYGTTVLAYLSADDPINEAIDLAGLTTDPASARKVTEAFLPNYDRVYREKFGAKVLGVWSYPAQVFYCNAEVKGLADIRGKKVRTASRTQAELVEALGGTPVTMSFGEVVPAMQNKVVDCGITGTLSGNFAKWYEVSTHLIPLPVSWGQMVFAVNLQTWAKTDPRVRAFIEREIKTLEKGVWDAVAFDSQDGIDCNTGKPTCKQGTKANMKLVEVSAADRAMLKKLVNEVIVPKWAARCSAECVRNWNDTVGPIVGVQAKK